MTVYLIKARRKRCLEVARSIRETITRKKRHYIVREVVFGGAVVVYSVAPDDAEFLVGWMHTDKTAANFLAHLLNLCQHLTAWGLAQKSTGFKQNV